MLQRLRRIPWLPWNVKGRPRRYPIPLAHIEPVERYCQKVMQPNVALGSTNPPQITVLDDSLINYGFEPGDTVPLQTGKPELNGVPVWELDGKFQARPIKHDGTGWATAYTSFLSAGKICYSLSPQKVGRLNMMGWIGCEFGVVAPGARLLNG